MSAFTQATQGTQGTYETRIVEIKSQIDEFKTDIELHLKESQTQRRL